MKLLKHVYTNYEPLYLHKKLPLWPAPTAKAPEEQQWLTLFGSALQLPFQKRKDKNLPELSIHRDIPR